MHKSLMSEAESMAFTAASPRDVKPPPQMAMVEPSHGLSQNPVFMGAAYPSRPNSWRTWRPSATFAQGLDPMPDDVQLPPPPPHALTARYSGFPRGSGVSTGADSSMPEYGAWPPTASNGELTGLAPAPGQQQQQQNLAPGYVVAAGPDRVQSRDYFRQQQAETGNGHESYVTYSETPLATPRTPIVVEGEQLAPQATSQEASPVDNCDLDSGDGGHAGRSARGDDIWRNEPERRQQQQQRVGRSSSSSRKNIGGDGRRGVSSGIIDGVKQPEGGIQEAQLGREAGAGGGHGGGAQGVEAEPPREQVQQAQQDHQPGEPGERGEQVFEEVAAVERQRRRMSSRRSSHALSSWDGDESGLSDAEFSDAGFSWSEAASERYTAVPSDGFGLSIIDMSSRHGSRSRRNREGGPGPSTTASPDADG